MKISKNLISAIILLGTGQALGQESNGVAAKASNMLPNVVSISPVQASENGWGIGFSYERTLDKNGILSFYGNVYGTFNTQTDYNGTGTVLEPMYYISPGIKLYPTSNNGKVKYAVGPSFIIASGKENNYDINGIGMSQDRFTLGVLVNNSVNFSPSTHIYAALEFGFGWSYLNTLNGTTTAQKGLTQFAFKIGYRY